ncbi:hypothetical protein ARMGADRAFT_1086579 [Armillaria gallica]|uniref:Uncharacterized protein n=1 Tax=Armillaria gallica TaxID=47427 RepID=A0A2H3CY52_ARMGA|nr:hypothetical protein ARMGADRAFT_1086579 [Armillaria gallica]
MYGFSRAAFHELNLILQPLPKKGTICSFSAIYVDHWLTVTFNSSNKLTDPMTEIISALFSLTEAEMDSLGPFVPSFFAARRAGGVVLDAERSRILQHWEDHFPHTFLTLTDFRKSPEDMAYVHCKKLEKIELFLVRIGYLMKGEAPKDALESGMTAIMELANAIKDLEAPRPVAHFTTPPDILPTASTHDMASIAALTLGFTTLATEFSSKGYYTCARAHAECILDGSTSTPVGQAPGPENFRIHNPPPRDWSLTEESLPPLFIVEDSGEDDEDDVQDNRNDIAPRPSQHPTSLGIDEGALVVAATTADLGAGSKEEVYRQLAAPDSVASDITDMTSEISLDEWVRIWLPTYDPNFRLGVSQASVS